MHACTLQRSKEIVKISLGAQAINELLGGGLESKCITEIYGEFRCVLPVQMPVV
jgi:meiotic recombination protein DMC1